MNEDSLKTLLEQVKEGNLSTDDALKNLKDFETLRYNLKVVDDEYPKIFQLVPQKLYDPQFHDIGNNSGYLPQYA